MAEYIFYFDTSIWIDIYDKSGYNGEVATKLIDKIITYDCIVLYSEIVITELKKLGFSDYEINQMLSIAKPDHLRRANYNKSELMVARNWAKQRNVPLGDVFHAMIARDYGAQLISRDRDFEKLKDITHTKLPEEFL